MVYQQLTQEQRYLIYKLLKLGYKQNAIAKQAVVHPSTISRELRRNKRKKGYRPKLAHRLAMKRRQVPRKKTILVPRTCTRLRHYLKKGWSPDQIAGRLKREGTLSISYQTIYNYIWANRKTGGVLYTKLRRKGIRYRKHRSHGAPIKNPRSIDQRPPCVDARSRLGDWELDTIVSSDRKSAIVSMVERVSQYTLLGWIPRNCSYELSQCVVRMMKAIQNRVHTLTSDNGAEFAGHRYMEQRLNTMFYFAHPCCPHERGLNEQVNGLVREYLPKGMSFSGLSQLSVSEIMKALNSRPRKTLNYKTPREIFYSPVALGL